MTAPIFGLPATIPPQLAEAGNGFVAILLAVTIGLLVTYVGEHAGRVRYEYEPPWSRRVLFRVYRERKAAIAISVGLLGIEVKTIAIWLARHLENHGFSAASVLPHGFAPLAYMIGTAMLGVGFTCWLRVTMPLSIGEWTVGGRRVGWMVWPGLLLIAALWSIWMAS